MGSVHSASLQTLSAREVERLLAGGLFAAEQEARRQRGSGRTGAGGWGRQNTEDVLFWESSAAAGGVSRTQSYSINEGVEGGGGSGSGRNVGSWVSADPLSRDPSSLRGRAVQVEMC